MGMRSASRREQTLPMREEARERMLLDRLDLPAQFSQGFAANLAQDFSIAPLAMEATGTESALEHAAFVCEHAKRIFNVCGVERKAVSHLTLRKWAMGAGEAAHEFKDRLRDRLHESCGQPGRKRNAERVAIARRIFGGDEAAFAGNAQFQKAASANQPVYMLQKLGEARRRASSSRERSPRRRQRSWMPSAERARCDSTRHCAVSSTSAMALASSNSRRSASPSSSRNWS